MALRWQTPWTPQRIIRRAIRRAILLLERDYRVNDDKGSGQGEGGKSEG